MIILAGIIKALVPIFRLLLELFIEIKAKDAQIIDGFRDPDRAKRLLDSIAKYKSCSDSRN